jgi:hypothetical protein
MRMPQALTTNDATPTADATNATGVARRDPCPKLRPRTTLAIKLIQPSPNRFLCNTN